MAKVYLDSVVVIYLIQGPESLSNAVRGALRAAEGEPPQVAISDLTRLECRVLPIREGANALLGQFDGFFDSQDIEKIVIQTEAFDLATELRARHGAKTPDSLHLAAAILGRCTEFWTNDHRLRAAADGRIGLKIFS
ncbi:MAG TPA: type II toxin-antitoxin system VapC family toxin [Thermoanaerobaculia bacterium]|nr:type II toxin-antitoxin system VapC family toxin [Thermoanaerobaculia bacterium]